MKAKANWLQKAAFVVLVLIFVMSVPKPVKCLTCDEQYEINSNDSMTKYGNCLIAAASHGGVGEIVLQNSLCQAEWDSRSFQYAAQYVSCMGLSVFGIKM